MGAKDNIMPLASLGTGLEQKLLGHGKYGLEANNDQGMLNPRMRLTILACPVRGCGRPLYSQSTLARSTRSGGFAVCALVATQSPLFLRQIN